MAQGDLTARWALALVSISAAAMGGCAATYEAPAAATAARLRIVTDPGVSVGAILHPSGRCEDAMEFASINSGVTSLFQTLPTLGMPTAEPLGSNRFVERSIPAGRSLLTLTTAVPYSQCHMTFSFEPKAGGDYQARVSANIGSCHVAMTRIEVMDGVARSFSVPVTSEPRCYKGLTY